MAVFTLRSPKFPIFEELGTQYWNLTTNFPLEVEMPDTHMQRWVILFCLL